MKTRQIVILLLLATAPAVAQDHMKPFAPWPGVWTGESSSWRGQTVKHSHVEEHIQFKLDGTLLLLEGTGTTTDSITHKQKTVHNALGLLSYDLNANRYNLRSHLSDGKSVDAWFTVVSDNHFQWGFDAGPGKIRYTITIDPAAKTWNEIGEYSGDGARFDKFFEMNLKKK